MSASGTSYTVDAMTAVHTTPQHEPGTLVTVDGFEYRYVKNSDTGTATSGCPVALENFTDEMWVCRYDLSTVIDGAILGVPMADLATGEYGWLLRDGVYQTCSVGDAVGEGCKVVAQGTDGVFRAATAGELFYTCGVAMEAATQAGTGVAIWVKGL